MRDSLLTVGLITVLSGGFLYGCCIHLRDRRRLRKALPARYETPAAERRKRLFDEVEGAQRAKSDALAIVAEAYARFGPLYEEPAPDAAVPRTPVR